MFELLPWCFAVAAVMLAPLLIWHAPDGTLGSQPGSWAALAYIGLIAGPFGTWCVMQATATLPTVVSSVGFLMTPAVSLILANLFLGEAFTTDLLFGSALIIGGVGAAAWPGQTDMILHAIEAGQGEPVWCCCMGCSGPRATSVSVQRQFAQTASHHCAGPAQSWCEPA